MKKFRAILLGMLMVLMLCIPMAAYAAELEDPADPGLSAATADIVYSEIHINIEEPKGGSVLNYAPSAEEAGVVFDVNTDYYHNSVKWAKEGTDLRYSAATKAECMNVYTMNLTFVLEDGYDYTERFTVYINGEKYKDYTGLSGGRNVYVEKSYTLEHHSADRQDGTVVCADCGEIINAIIEYVDVCLPDYGIGLALPYTATVPSEDLGYEIDCVTETNGARKNGMIWSNQTYGEVGTLKYSDNPVMLCGRTYRVSILVKAKDGYQFASKVRTLVDGLYLEEISASPYADVTVAQTIMTVHDLAYVEEKNATCTETGVRSHYECTRCGEWYRDQAGDNRITDPSTYTIAKYDHCLKKNGDGSIFWFSDGSKHWQECVDCHGRFNETAHTPGAAATATTPQTCTVCGYVTQDVLNGCVHDLAFVYGTESTCSKHGVKAHFVCSKCGNWYQAADGSGRILDPSTWILEELGEHYPRQQTDGTNTRVVWYSDANNHWAECVDCQTKFDVAAHTAGPAATAAKAQTCTVCGYLIKAATPALTKIANASTGVTVTWGAVSGAAKYRVYYKEVGTDTSWQKATDTTATSFTMTKLKTGKPLNSGKTYTFTVRCLSASGASVSGYNTTGISILYLANITPSISNVSTGLQIKWTKVAGAAGYYVYRKEGTAYKKIKTITSGSTVSYIDTAIAAKNGTAYNYCVKAYNGKTYGTYTAKSYYRLTDISISSLTNVSTRKLVVKWAKNTKAAGYQVQYATNSSFTSAKTVTVTGVSTLTTTLTSLTKGSTYYVRVRAYKTNSSGTKYYSAWSAKKYLKVTR